MQSVVWSSTGRESLPSPKLSCTALCAHPVEVSVTLNTTLSGAGPESGLAVKFALVTSPGVGKADGAEHVPSAALMGSHVPVPAGVGLTTAGAIYVSQGLVVGVETVT